MEVLYPHCAGLDVHKSLPSRKRGQTVVACARHMVNGTLTREVRRFGTTTKDLPGLSEWLASQGCTQVAMEATGVYWKPVWHILNDNELSLVLANAKHVKNLRGRKTDVNDATWLADLMAHGKRRSNRMRKGAPWLETTLIQCAWAATREKGSYFQAQFRRLRARRGAKKAIGAVAASILTAAYHMLKDGTVYHDLGPDPFDRSAKTVQTRRLLTRLQNLGYVVQITPLAA